jgi:ferredoxin
MNIVADHNRCEGHGLCVDQAPEVFDLDDDGNLLHRYDGNDIPDDLADSAQRAVDACPVAALRRG